MMRKRSLVALVLVPLIAGCVSLSSKAPEHLFSLTPVRAAPAGTAVAGRSADALIVAEPETDKRLAVLRVPVQVDDSSVAYLKEAAWVERPSRQFAGLLAETLRASGKRLVLAEDEAAGPGSTRLSGRLLDMGYDARQRAVVVRFDAILSNRDGTMRTQRFESLVSGIEPEPETVGPALNQAANDVASQVADWVG